MPVAVFPWKLFLNKMGLNNYLLMIQMPSLIATMTSMPTLIGLLLIKS